MALDGNLNTHTHTGTVTVTTQGNVIATLK